MADVFVSYARSDKDRVTALVAAIEAEGWSVWWDPEIAPGQEFDRKIAAELDAAGAVLVIWTPTSVESRWVRGEAREAADRGILVPVRLDAARLPIDVRAIHTTDLDSWNEDPSAPSFQALLRALGTVLAQRPAVQRTMAASTSPPSQTAAESRRVSICVLPFANMSGDPEQEYFSDGISEDIITDLSKVSALWVTARNTAFTFKDKNVNIPQIARQLKVKHVLEGSVRKSGQRVRITAQLIDGETGGHVWAERYDRDLNDIFALQDEISRAIVAVLKLKLLPEESTAIGQRSTTNPEAYKFYLMARHYSVMGTMRHQHLIVRLCRRALEIDPNYALAWALLSIGLSILNVIAGEPGDNGLEAAERALALDPGLPLAHAARARVLVGLGRYDEAMIEIATALRFDPDSYEANAAAGRCAIATRRHGDAIAYLEKAAQVYDTDFWALGMALQSYTALGDRPGTRSAARRTLDRVERVLAAEPDHGTAMGFGVAALFVLGENERASELAERAMLLDPDNINLHYNLACAMAKAGLGDRALDLLSGVVNGAQPDGLRWIRVDSDLDSLRSDPRFEAMLAAAEARHSSPRAGANTASPKT
jgi:adenylate cyclase